MAGNILELRYAPWFTPVTWWWTLETRLYLTLRYSVNVKQTIYFKGLVQQKKVIYF